MSYNTYYLKTLEEDYQDLIHLGALLGVIEVVFTEQGERVNVLDGAWHYIGYIYEPTGVMLDGTDSEGNPIQVPEVKPIEHPSGKKYVHVNMRTKIDLFDRASMLAGGNPEIAQAMANISRFFIPSATPGRARAPNNPRYGFL
jgi:hypothetical protein